MKETIAMGPMVEVIGLVGAGMAVEHFFGKTSQQYRSLVLCFATMLLAFFIWTLDKAGQFRSPESWFQGHAVWHLLTAITLGSAAMFYRSEVPITR